MVFQYLNLGFSFECRVKDDILPHIHEEVSPEIVGTRVSSLSKKAILGCLEDGIVRPSKVVEAIRRSNMEKEELGVPRAKLPVTPEKSQVSGVLYRHRTKTHGSFTVYPQDLRELMSAFSQEPEDKNDPFFLSLNIREDLEKTFVVLVATTRNLLDFGPDRATIALDAKHNASFQEFKLLVAATLDGNGTSIIKGKQFMDLLIF